MEKGLLDGPRQNLSIVCMSNRGLGWSKGGPGLSWAMRSNRCPERSMRGSGQSKSGSGRSIRGPDGPTDV